MISIVGVADLPVLHGRNAVAVGVFDGVHIGHRRLLSVLKDEAVKLGGDAVVLTFEKHPSELVAPESAPLYIDTIEQRARYLKSSGADEVVIVRFDWEFANLTPEAFVKKVLIDRLSASAVVVGPNFRFGKRRSGDVNTLRELCGRMGVAVKVVPPLIVDGEFVSSTRIRTLISNGDVAAASELLGRNFVISGIIVHGERIGHQIGFPTANVEVEGRQLVPADGVYAAAFSVKRKTFELAVVSIGVRPTVGGRTRSIEVHIPGFTGNIYGEKVEVEFKRRLRSEQKFESLEALAEQIEKDIEAARLCCLNPPAPSDPGSQA